MATTASVKWDHGLTFEGTAATGFKVPIGGSPEEGGDNDGFRPTELLLISLAGCTAMDVISILQKKRQDVTGFEVNVHGERASEHPRVFTHLTVEYVVRGRNVDPEAVRRSIELSTTKYCTVHAMLEKAAALDHTYRIVEESAPAPA